LSGYPLKYTLVQSGSSPMLSKFIRNHNLRVGQISQRGIFGKLFNFDGLEAISPVCIIGDESKLNIKWRTLSDVDYGGTSVCEQEVSSGNKLVFKGVVRSPDISTKAKGGFCAAKGLLMNKLDLRDYEGFELSLRGSPSMTIALNMTTDSLFEDDLYQVLIPIKEESTIVQVRFSEFKLTARGSEREYQRNNDSLQLQSIGFLVNRVVDIPFQVELESIIALPHFERTSKFSRPIVESHRNNNL
jgi:Complex I intermediate-associated protein 30 (CIA30)